MNWTYTRSNRKHYINDGRPYGKRGEFYLWEIRPVLEERWFYHKRKDGYELFYKGKRVKNSQTVTLLKKFQRLMTGDV